MLCSAFASWLFVDGRMFPFLDSSHLQEHGTVPDRKVLVRSNCFSRCAISSQMTVIPNPSVHIWTDSKFFRWLFLACISAECGGS